MSNRWLSLSAAALVAGALALASPARADDAYIAEQTPTQYLAKDRLIGAKVHDANNVIVGDIEDLIIGSDDQVVGAIMGVGGFLGVGEKKVAVRLSALQLEATDGKLHVVLASATKESLAAAPAFKRVAPKKGLLERALEKGAEIRDKSGVTATDTYKAVKEKAGPALEKAQEAAQDVIEKAKEAAKPAHPAEGTTP
ncbi:MAG: PRC-barrel domain-containing protein [Hyphomicrobium sp.]